MNDIRGRYNLFFKIKQYIRTHKLVSGIVAGLLLIAIAGLTFVLLNQKPEPAPETPAPKAVTPKPKPITYYSPLTGEKVDSENDTKMPVTAIMIENSPSARPQSGLKQAGIVYEAIAEGGITRFLALYQQSKPELVGPVRSLRMYFVDWLSPYDASIAHVGGSASALREVRNGNYRDIDQFFNAGTYWRATDRYAPHNVYTNFENIDALNEAKGYDSSSFIGFKYQDGKTAEVITASSVSINFSSYLYNTMYTYNPANNTYDRSLGGSPHMDREAGQISPSSVVAMRVDMHRVMEDGYREAIKTTGSGSAVVFQDGTAQEVTWHKADRHSPLKLTDSSGNDIKLNRGQTWIAAVPNQGGSISWQ